jgi:dTDP-4-dehydrorhamnose reductase
MRLLLTGAGGQLGGEVASEFVRQGYELIAPLRRELDFREPERVAARIGELHPDWVVNCAAYTQVDRAESEPGAALTVNRDTPARLAAAVAGYGGRLLQVSTDFVFDGEQSRPYRETDAPHPLGVYGRSKREGEQAVQAVLPDALILRTAWVYGVQGGNFVKTILRQAIAGKPLRVVDDQIGTPTWARNIAGAMAALVRNEARGVYHYTDAGTTSWFGFACAILEASQQAGFDVRTATVAPVATADYPTAARRPAYSVLDTHKMQSLLAAPIPHWRDSLAHMLRELHSCADCL